MKNLMTTLLILFHVCTLIAQSEKPKFAQPSPKSQINKIGNDQKIQQAFQIIEQLEPETMKELIELTEIPAPPFQEQKRAERYRQMLQNAGVDSIWIDEVGNVLALRRGKSKGKTVLIEGHLDTVFPADTDVSIKMKGDTLFAPGIADDTRALSVVLTILKAMNRAKISTESDILFAGTVGEEGLGDLRGIKHIFKTKSLKIDSHIALDGGNISGLVTNGLGSVRYKITLNGPGGHSWGAFGLANPHHALGKAIDYFNTAASKFVEIGPKTSYNIGRIGGGTSVNSIPFESWIEVDLRSISPEKLHGIEQILLKEFNKALIDYNSTIKTGTKLTVQFEKIGERPSGLQNEELPLIQKAIAAIEFFKASPSLGTGSTNSNIPISLGVPSITIGRGGNGGNTHSLDEWWINENGAEGIKFGLLMLIAEAGLIQ
ncbi:MAG: M20/M25/M40 family metallo-hydrolase [Bacteroidetes bacterium]|nr:M20/M25/M40 family metallo-hydrolase [Bacteroidota bacterium]